MAIDLTGANTYFGSSVHTKSEQWTRLPATRRAAAIEHARIIIELFIGDSTLDADTTTNADFPRHDAAVYEQALWMLEKQDTEAENRALLLRQNSGGAFANNISAAIGSKGSIAPEAIRFLVQYPRVIKLVRG